MARSRLLLPKTDFIKDSGTVLFSFIQGEQIEFPMTLGFLDLIYARANNYTFEAVVVEGENVTGQEEYPTNVRSNGEKRTLFVRLPIYREDWDAQQVYNKEDVVLYEGVYYKLRANTGYTSLLTPVQDDAWAVTTLDKIYVQFPKELGSTWEVQPSVSTPGYGFFELSITEPTDSIFSRTMKPIRGMVELLFSPTEVTTTTPTQTTP